jgi:hypothetical protein
MTPSGTLACYVFIPLPEGGQSYTNDKVAAPLEEHAKRLGHLIKPIRFHDHQRRTLHKLMNDGSTLVIARIGDLVPYPSEAKEIISPLLSKGIRIFVAELGQDVTSHLQMLYACAAAWSPMEETITMQRQEAAKDRATAAARERELATRLAENIVRAGIVAGVRDAVLKAYPETNTV